MLNKKVSVIMPAYNVEKCIAESIESVINQTYRNLELVIVDDGSIDNTAQVVESYIKKDKRIKFYSQKNSGQSSARNKALDKSDGYFVMFLDSDDLFLNNDAIEICVNSMNNNFELTVFNSKYLDRKGVLSKYKCLSDSVYPKTSMKISVPENKFFASFSNVCFACFRRDIIEKNNIRFVVGSIFEDWDFMLDYSTYCKNINFINEAFYAYRDNPTSTTKKMGTKVFDVFKIYNSIQSKLIKRNLWEYGKQITQKKIMFSLPLLYDNMCLTIDNAEIIDDYLLQSRKILRSIPDDFFAESLDEALDPSFLLVVRSTTYKHVLDRKLKTCRRISQILTLPFMTNYLRPLRHRLRSKIRKFLISFL